MPSGKERRNSELEGEKEGEDDEHSDSYEEDSSVTSSDCDDDFVLRKKGSK